MTPDMDIVISRNDRGYYVLTIDGRFEGNFDTLKEAADESERILFGGEDSK